MEQPPPLPPHQSPPPAWSAPIPPPAYSGRRFLWMFLAGALGGAAVSAVVWPVGFKAISSGDAFFLVFAVPAVKLAIGIPLLCFRKWRGLGAGIMVSIALGFLIFFGNCMTYLK